MLPQDAMSVPRRSLDIEDYIGVVRRHKAWIFGPTFAGLVIAVVVAFLWPDTYMSTARIRVVPPQVPEAYVPPNITTDMQARVTALTQVILNRASLTNLINKYQLYKKDLTRMPMDDVVESMRKNDIHLGAVENFAQSVGGPQRVPAFVIGFSYSNRFVAQKVTEDLAASFITESMREQEQQSLGTTDFLKTQLDDAKHRLDDAEQKLQAFRAHNLGHLPDQIQSNYSQINAIQAQMINIDSQMGRAQQEKMQLEGEMRIQKQQLSSLKDPNADPVAIEQRNDKLLQKDREIQYVETQLAALRERYRETYPDVQNAINQLAALKRQREEILKEDANKKPDTPRVLPPNPVYERDKRNYEANIQRLESAIKAKDMEITTLKNESARLTESLKSYQMRLEGTPLGEKEYTQLLADAQLARAQYEMADKKASQSKEASSLMSRQQGERLTILDPANVPQTHTEPKRPFIVSVGSGLGLLLGLVLSGIREVKDTSLKNLKDVRAYTQLPILGSIPLLENDLVVRRRRRLSWLAWATACLVGIMIMSSSVAYYYMTKS